MPIVQATLSFEELVAAVNQLSVAEKQELRKRLDKAHGNGGAAQSSSREKSVLNRTKTRIATLMSQTDAALLAIIESNSKLPSAELRRYNRLRRKGEIEEMTDAEWSELQKLTQHAEQMAVVRLEALIALAQKRGTDVDTLMRELGFIKKHDVV